MQPEAKPAHFMPKKRSDSQIEASRRNGAISRGPITPHGKYNSSRNSLKHGLLAQVLLLPGESRAQFTELFDSLVAEYQPVTPTEKMCVQNMIAAQWRIFRAWNYERIGMLQEGSAAQIPEILTDAGVWHEPAARDAVAFFALHAPSRSGSTIQISEIRYQNQFARALKQLNYIRNHNKNEKRTRETPAVIEESLNPEPDRASPDTEATPSGHRTDTRPSQ